VEGEGKKTSGLRACIINDRRKDGSEAGLPPAGKKTSSPGKGKKKKLEKKEKYSP